MWRRALATAAAGAIVGLLLVSSGGTARADYGSGEQYQIEISANCDGPSSCIPTFVNGFGIWFWAELNAGGTGDYEAADCVHAGSGNVGPTGAFHDSGDVTWWYSDGGSTITIAGATVLGSEKVPITITVPAEVGHYTQPFSQVIDATALGLGPLPGWAQVQVAP
jgi:hypothetical protein